MARKYTSIWWELKKHGHCTIAVHVKLHARIVKAVTCEKNRDDGYKLLKAEERKKVILAHTKDGAKIRFFLTEYTIDGKICAEDL